MQRSTYALMGLLLGTLVQSARAVDFIKDAAAPPYSDRLDVQQAFLDLRFPVTKGPEADPILRIGRQEMAFGSQRLVSIRDAPNVRRAFDGVRLGGLAGKTRYDVFATRP